MPQALGTCPGDDRLEWVVQPGFFLPTLLEMEGEQSTSPCLHTFGLEPGNSGP